MRSQQRLTTIFLCLTMTNFVSACGNKGLKDEKEEDSSSDNAPAPPSPYTLSVDLTLSEQGTDLDVTETLGANHLKAAVYVVAVNVNVAAHLFVPVALLRSASAAAPVLTGENTWTRSYQLTTDNRTWTANLTGRRLSDTANSWQMRVTSSPVDANGCCTDFLLFDGQSSTAGSGSWQLYDPTKPAAAAKLFSIVYDYRSETDKTLVFTVNSAKPASERFGSSSSVNYRISGANISMQVFDSSEGASRTIAWNKATQAGSHTDLQGNKACWAGKDENLIDVACQ